MRTTSARYALFWFWGTQCEAHAPSTGRPVKALTGPVYTSERFGLDCLLQYPGTRSSLPQKAGSRVSRFPYLARNGQSQLRPNLPLLPLQRESRLLIVTAFGVALLPDSG